MGKILSILSAQQRKEDERRAWERERIIQKILSENPDDHLPLRQLLLSQAIKSGYFHLK